MTGQSRYFIGIVPPSPLYEQVQDLKQHFSEHYQTLAALRSPPHITLHMPFEWKSRKEDQLVENMRILSSRLSVVTAELRDFGCFRPRVIFIYVLPSTEMIALQHELQRFCRMEMGLLNAGYKDLPFHPHMTLAFRDLKKPAFAKAWEEFKDMSFEASFVVKNISLLKHDGRTWEVFESFALHSRTVG